MIKSFIIYTQFFTRIAIPKAIDLSYMKKGIPILPLFGLSIGLLLALLYYILQLFLVPSLAFILTLLGEVLLTSGFHLDALADTADGLFSSRNKERMLEIMKDSRVGTNGVLALIFYYLILFTVFNELPNDLWIRFNTLLIMGMLGKNGIVLQTYNMKYARSNSGLGQVFTGVKKRDVLLAQCLTLLISFLLFNVAGLIAYGCTTLISLLYKQFVIKKIDGQTGDTLGASVEIAKIITVIGLLIWF